MKLAIVFAGHAGNFAHIELVPLDRVAEHEKNGLLTRWRGSVYYMTTAGHRAFFTRTEKLGSVASYRNHALVT